MVSPLRWSRVIHAMPIKRCGMGRGVDEGQVDPVVIWFPYWDARYLKNELESKGTPKINANPPLRLKFWTLKDPKGLKTIIVP